MLDRFGCCHTASAVTVETEGHALETEARQPLEKGRARSSTAQRRDVPDATRAEMVNVEESLDENDLTRSWRLPDDP
jgi:hypothetical protein